jgi:hypothetical protein
MVEVLVPFFGGLDKDLEVGFDFFLADELVEISRPQTVFEKQVLFGPDRSQDGRHRISSFSPSLRGALRRGNLIMDLDLGHSL